MKLTYLGQPIDPKTNIEWFTKNPFGFTATVTYKEGTTYHDCTRNSKMNNLTEVHNNFNNSGSIAFESDLHGTGCTREIKDINTCDITIATEMAESF